MQLLESLILLISSVIFAGLITPAAERKYQQLNLPAGLQLQPDCDALKPRVSCSRNRYDLLVLIALGCFLIALSVLAAPDFTGSKPEDLGFTNLLGRIIRFFGLCFAGAISVLLALFDLQYKRLPNRLVLALLVVFGAILSASVLLENLANNFAIAILTSTVSGLVFGVVALFSPKTLGMGDAKLAAVLGFWHSWFSAEQALLVALLSFEFGIIISLTNLVAGYLKQGFKRLNRRKLNRLQPRHPQSNQRIFSASFAFGPPMLLASWLTYLAQQIMTSYW